jgi:hypothetical protein
VIDLTELVNVLGNGSRNIQYEAYEISGVFKAHKTMGERDVNINDFCILDNRNIGLLVEIPITELQSSGKYESRSYTILIEYVNDYPLSPPNVFVIDPILDPNENPHMYLDGKICYLRPEDWSSNYTSYDVAQMIKSWIYAYSKWKRNGEWAWEQQEHTQ